MQRQQEQNKRPVVDHIKLNLWYVKLYLYSPLFILLYVHVYAIFVEVLCFFFGLQVSYTSWYIDSYNEYLYFYM